MKKNNLNKVIYQLTVEDLQNVANKEINRSLTESELNLLQEKIGDLIDWYETINNAIRLNIDK